MSKVSLAMTASASAIVGLSEIAELDRGIIWVRSLAFDAVPSVIPLRQALCDYVVVDPLHRCTGC